MLIGNEKDARAREFENMSIAISLSCNDYQNSEEREVNTFSDKILSK
jgi:hypothetical protein